MTGSQFTNEPDNARLSESALASLDGALKEDDFINIVCLTGLSDLFYKLAHYLQCDGTLPVEPAFFLDFGVRVWQPDSLGTINIELREADFAPVNVTALAEVFLVHLLSNRHEQGGKSTFFIRSDETAASNCLKVAESIYARARDLYRDASTLESC